MPSPAAREASAAARRAPGPARRWRGARRRRDRWTGSRPPPRARRPAAAEHLGCGMGAERDARNGHEHDDRCRHRRRHLSARPGRGNEDHRQHRIDRGGEHRMPRHAGEVDAGDAPAESHEGDLRCRHEVPPGRPAAATKAPRSARFADQPGRSPPPDQGRTMPDSPRRVTTPQRTSALKSAGDAPRGRRVAAHGMRRASRRREDSRSDARPLPFGSRLHQPGACDGCSTIGSRESLGSDPQRRRRRSH